MKDREICLGGAGNFSVYATAAFDNPPEGEKIIDEVAL